MLENLLKWVASAILPQGYEVRVSPDKKLEVEDGEAKLKRSEKPGEPKDPSEVARKSVLENITDYEAARRATKNEYVKDTVLRNPELVGAESQLEAELKLDIASGESIGDKIDNNPRITESEAKDMLGKEWSTRWGYNEYGDSLPGKIDGSESDSQTDTEGNGEAESETDSGNSSTESDTTTSTQTATEVEIDTDAGDINVTSSPNSGGGANTGGGPNA